MTCTTLRKVDLAICGHCGARRVPAVIASCHTLEQLKVAEQYAHLAFRRIDENLSSELWKSVNLMLLARKHLVVLHGT